MIFEMTYQIRVKNFTEGLHWYETLLNKKPDFVPHEGFAEWELIPGCWLQLAKGRPSVESGPIRLGIEDLVKERERLMNQLQINRFEIHRREEVPVKWATFKDPWGNQLGFFEYLDKKEKDSRKLEVLGNK